MKLEQQRWLKRQTKHSHLIIGPLWEGLTLTDGSRASSSADLPRWASSLWSATFGSCRSLCFSFEEGERFAEALWWDTPGTDVRLERPGWTMSISRLEVVVAWQPCTCIWGSGMIRFQSSVPDHNSNLIVPVPQMLDLIHDNHSMSQTESVTILSCPGLQWGLKKA